MDDLGRIGQAKHVGRELQEQVDVLRGYRDRASTAIAPVELQEQRPVFDECDLEQRIGRWIGSGRALLDHRIERGCGEWPRGGVARGKTRRQRREGGGGGGEPQRQYGGVASQDLPLRVNRTQRKGHSDGEALLSAILGKDVGRSGRLQGEGIQAPGLRHLRKQTRRRMFDRYLNRCGVDRQGLGPRRLQRKSVKRRHVGQTRGKMARTLDHALIGYIAAMQRHCVDGVGVQRPRVCRVGAVQR